MPWVSAISEYCGEGLHRISESLEGIHSTWRQNALLTDSQRRITCIRVTYTGGLRRRSATARPLRLWIRILPGAWMSVCCECCVLSGRGLCGRLITGPEESYRLRCVVVYDVETSRKSRPCAVLDHKRNIYIYMCVCCCCCCCCCCALTVLPPTSLPIKFTLPPLGITPWHTHTHTHTYIYIYNSVSHSLPNPAFL